MRPALTPSGEGDTRPPSVDDLAVARPDQAADAPRARRAGARAEEREVAARV